MIPVFYTLDESVLPALRRWQRAVADLTPFWTEAFAPRFLSDIQDNWEVEGSYSEPGGWEPLAPGYAAWKARRFGAHLGILELSLRLRGSLQWLGSDIGPEGIFRPTPQTLTIGTSVPYAEYHQKGMSPVAERIFLFLNLATDYDEIWEKWMMGRAAAAGFDVE